MTTNKKIELLKAYGADIEGAMERFMNDVEFYESCLDIFIEDESFEALGNALKDKDYQAAFEAAHSLKGVSGNLGLTPITKVISDEVELLRNNQYETVDKEYEGIILQLNKIKGIVKE